MLHDVEEVGLKELHSRVMSCKLLQEGEEDVEPHICHIPHCVLERPDHCVQYQLELW